MTHIRKDRHTEYKFMWKIHYNLSVAEALRMALVNGIIVTNIFLPLRDGAIFFELRVVCGAVVVLFLF